MELQTRSKKELAKGWGKAFGLCLLISILAFLPMLIMDTSEGSFFSYIIDYNSQMIPFNRYMVHHLHDGGSFSWATDLGSGFIDSYTYYGLGSLFFWPLYFVPENLIPYVMPGLLCLKFAIAGGGAFLWLQRWTKSGALAILTACLYAFSGQMFYNVIYYFFLDTFALFPYLLAALDETLLENKFGRFWLWITVSALTNYFFFVAEVVFLLLYFACMIYSGYYKLSKRLLLKLLLESVGGVLMACVLLLPAVSYIIQNHRATSKLLGSDILFYKNTETYLAILKGMFLLPDRPGSENLLNDSVTWSTPTSYLPLVGVSGGLALLRSKKNHPFKPLLLTCLLFAIVPILNSSFTFFNATYYSRWFFMPTLILCGAAAVALDDNALRTDSLPKAAKSTFLITASFSIFAILPTMDDTQNLRIGVVKNQLLFWLPFLFSLSAAGYFYYLLKKHRQIEKLIAAMLTPTVLFTALGGMMHLSLARADAGIGTEQYAANVADITENVAQLHLPTENARIDIYSGGSLINAGVWLDKSCIQSYSSTVAPAVTTFYNSFSLSRDVTSNIPSQLYGFRGLLSVRYLLVPLSSEDDWQEELKPTEVQDDASLKVSFVNGDSRYGFQTVALRGWHSIAETECYAVYENENFVPMGFAYDNYITQKQFESTVNHLQSSALLRGILLSDEQVRNYADLVQPLPDSALLDMDYETYEADCAARKADAVTEFVQTNTGFTAVTDYESDRLVFFSVPYDSGFTALINGNSVKIEDVDNGLMAIRVPAGHNNIVFTYHTPGLSVGICLSLLALLAYIAYLSFVFYKRRTK